MGAPICLSLATRRAAGMKAGAGFTLVELLVSMVVLVIIVLLMALMTNQANGIWRGARARIETFQAARNAFERVTSTLSQATLNTYLDYYRADGKTRTDWLAAPDSPTFLPSTYDRASDLQFVCGPSAVSQGGTTALIPPTSPKTAAARPTHAIFFQAPLGRVNNPTGTTDDFKNLDRVLNAVGYYIDFTDDSALTPAFITSAAPSWHYRLMELNQPSQNLGIYFSAVKYANPGAWFSLAVDPPQPAGGGPSAAAPVVVTADDVIALVIRPKSPASTTTTPAPEIAPFYAYDTKAYKATPGDSYAKMSKNQLPPIVQVTLVAIDSVSSTRLAAQNGSTPPALVAPTLFADVTKYTQDLATLQNNLQLLRCNYRVFAADVSVPGAKWSQTN